MKYVWLCYLEIYKLTLMGKYRKTFFCHLQCYFIAFDNDISCVSTINVLGEMINYYYRCSLTAVLKFSFF